MNSIRKPNLHRPLFRELRLFFRHAVARGLQFRLGMCEHRCEHPLLVGGEQVARHPLHHAIDTDRQARDAARQLALRQALRGAPQGSFSDMGDT